MLFVTYWPKNGHPCCQKGQYIQNWSCVNPLNAKLNPICHLLALLGAHPIFHVSGIRVKRLKLILFL